MKISQNLMADDLRFVAVVSDGKEQSSDSFLSKIQPNVASYFIRKSDNIAIAINKENISIHHQSTDSRDVVVIGDIVSEDCNYGDSIRLAVSKLDDGLYEDLAKFQGVYTLLVVDWKAEKVLIVSDLIGMQPFYIADYKGAKILSDRAEALPRLGGAKIDPLGFAGWIYFGVPLSNRTLFESVSRIKPASVTICERGMAYSKKYWSPLIAEEIIDDKELTDGVYGEFVASLKRLMQPFSRGTVLLSGGFDSRFCLLAAQKETDSDVSCVTVPYTDAEHDIVKNLSEQAGIVCDQVKIKGSIWDVFDSMWYRHPDGFVRWRNLSLLGVTRSKKSDVIIDGSHSDVALRCSRGGPADGSILTEPEARDYVWNVSTHHKVESFFQSNYTGRLEPLARLAADEQSDDVGWSSKFCRIWNIQVDERRNIAFNHLQYAHLRPSIQPFYDRALMERRLRYSNKVFTADSYRAMLKRHFPGSGELPHADDLPRGKAANYVFSWALWKKLPAVMYFLGRHGEVLNRNWLIPCLAEYSVGFRSHMYVVLELMRFVKLEEELASFGIELDFRNIFK